MSAMEAFAVVLLLAVTVGGLYAWAVFAAEEEGEKEE